jgi:mRNA interferase MazF
MSPLPVRGEVWWWELSDIGRRPVVVQSRDAVNPKLKRALVAPCTTTIRGLASEVVLEPGHDPVPLRSRINLDSVESVSVVVLVERLGRLSDQRMREVCSPQRLHDHRHRIVNRGGSIFAACVIDAYAANFPNVSFNTQRLTVQAWQLYKASTVHLGRVACGSGGDASHGTVSGSHCSDGYVG